MLLHIFQGLAKPLRAGNGKLAIMHDFAGNTPSAILVHRDGAQPLFMAHRPDLPENPLSAQIYLETE
ncbi:hypothetical protein B5M06_10630 [Comamonas kerstersii]|uniref:Uncharacterized protein n=1 Tax=Comamonas kerstersii TaxID=225992 RepID=A0A1V3TJS0_9BURK|nr:hypothetical protein B5M06_10630 [Comamonas kerstersii]OOH86044.1 hypothetical protein BMF38_10535 [Comamonas kerstersii]OOH93543.1 hypothetical protein BMF29_06070 [Comamonas kerstersii]